MAQYLSALEEAENTVRALFESSMNNARVGFWVATVMDIVVFILGVTLIVVSASMAMKSDASFAAWAGVGGVGVLGVLYEILIGKPRAKVREAVNHLMHLQIVFLGYVRQLHQSDQAFTRRLLDEKPIETVELTAFTTAVAATMKEAAERLAMQAPKPAG